MAIVVLMAMVATATVVSYVVVRDSTEVTSRDDDCVGDSCVTNAESVKRDDERLRSIPRDELLGPLYKNRDEVRDTVSKIYSGHVKPDDLDEGVEVLKDMLDINRTMNGMLTRHHVDSDRGNAHNFTIDDILEYYRNLTYNELRINDMFVHSYNKKVRI